jgi:hypothetical protein
MPLTGFYASTALSVIRRKQGMGKHGGGNPEIGPGKGTATAVEGLPKAWAARPALLLGLCARTLASG